MCPKMVEERTYTMLKFLENDLYLESVAIKLDYFMWKKIQVG